MLFGKINRLCELAITQPNQIAASAIHGIKPAVYFGKPRIPFGGKSGASGLRKIGHFLEAGEPALIEGFKYLCGAVGGRNRVSQFDPLAIEYGLHSEARCGISWSLINLST